MVGRFGEAAALQEDGGAMTRRTNEAPKGLVDAPHPGETVAFVKSGLAVMGGVRGDAGFTDAIDLWEGGTDHDGGMDAPPEGVDAFGITGAKDKEEGVLCKESGLDEGLLFSEFKAAWLNRGTRLGFKGFKVGADVFGVLIGTEKDRNGNTRTARDAGRHRAGGGFKMEVAVFESGIDAGIDRDAVGVLAPGGVTFHHL